MALTLNEVPIQRYEAQVVYNHTRFTISVTCPKTAGECSWEVRGTGRYNGMIYGPVLNSGRAPTRALAEKDAEAAAKTLGAIFN
jgi:hypothetical protein